MTRSELEAKGYSRRTEQVTALRFACVGLVGFLTEAGILSLLIYGFRADPLLSRGLSFSFAVIVTFALNRGWSFEDHSDRSVLRLLIGYLGVQITGSVCNLAVYAVAMGFLRYPLNAPLIALVLAASVALAVNYVGARWLVFQRKAA